MQKIVGYLLPLLKSLLLLLNLLDLAGASLNRRPFEATERIDAEALPGHLNQRGTGCLTSLDLIVVLAAIVDSIFVSILVVFGQIVLLFEDRPLRRFVYRLLNALYHRMLSLLVIEFLVFIVV